MAIGGIGRTPGKTFVTTNDGRPGSNGSIFGPGQNGAGKYPAGTWWTWDTTARGPAAISMIADGVIDELGPLALFIKGKASGWNRPGRRGLCGDFANRYHRMLVLYSELPVQLGCHITSQLGTGMMIPGRREDSANTLSNFFQRNS